MQTRAVELGWVNGVVIAVRSTFSDHPGTLIQEAGPMEIRDKVRGLALDRKVAKVTLVGVPDRQLSLAGIALKSANAKGAYTELLWAGFQPHDVLEFSRPVALPGAAREAQSDPGRG